MYIIAVYLRMGALGSNFPVEIVKCRSAEMAFYAVCKLMWRLCANSKAVPAECERLKVVFVAGRLEIIKIMSNRISKWRYCVPAGQ